MTRLGSGLLAAALTAFAGPQEFRLAGPAGGAAVFSTAQADVTALIFISTKCPVSNAYNDRMNAIYNEFSGERVQFLFVNANDNEPLEEIREHARSAGFPFPVHKDLNNALADRLGAQSTPEAFVFARNGELRYHGFIDDQKNPARVKVDGLRNALNSVLAGRSPEPSRTKAFGCTIKRVRKSS